MSQLLVTEVVAFSLRVIPMVYKGEAKSQGYKVKGLGLFDGNESLEVHISFKLSHGPIGRENQKIATFYISEFKVLFGDLQQ